MLCFLALKAAGGGVFMVLRDCSKMFIKSGGKTSEFKEEQSTTMIIEKNKK